MTKRYHIAFKGSWRWTSFSHSPMGIENSPTILTERLQQRACAQMDISDITWKPFEEDLLFFFGVPLLIWLILRNKQNVFNCYILLQFQPAWEQVLLYTAVSSYPGSRLHDTFHLFLNSADEFLQKTARQGQRRVAALFTARESNQSDFGWGDQWQIQVQIQAFMLLSLVV